MDGRGAAPLQSDDYQSVKTIARQLLQVHHAAAGFGVFVLDSTGHVMSWNPLARRVSGYCAQEILGRNLACLYSIDEVARSRVARALTKAAAVVRYENQAVLRRKNYASFWAEIMYTAVRGASGKLLGFGCVIRDISDRKRDQVELAGARARAVESSRLKSAFAENISHEFRTPLNIILGYSDLIGEHLAETHDNSQNDSIDAVSRACKRLLRTLNAMLDYSNLEARYLTIKSRTVALVPFVQKLIDEISGEALLKGLGVTFEFDDASIAIFVDEYCLRNALRNLLENAVKFTETGTIAVRLNRERTGTVCLSVADTGIGIESGFIPHLMEPFTQEDRGPARRFEGTGLGLALAQRFLELNGASLTVVSEKSRGSIFTIRFPLPNEVVHERSQVIRKK